MAGKIAELKKDIAELEALEKQASRKKVKDILSIETRKLVSEVIKLEEELNCTIAKTPAPVSTTPKTYQVKLNNYAWDQSNKFVKFYVTLQKVQGIPAENIHCNFTNKSLELHVKNLDNKDYVLTINKLLYTIKPEESNWKVKSDMILINAAKVDPVNWSHVTELEKKSEDSKKMGGATGDSDDKTADPTSGLMSIMRDMYEKGDDEMKRTIAKTWSDVQSKGPMY